MVPLQGAFTGCLWGSVVALVNAAVYATVNVAWQTHTLGVAFMPAC